MEWHVGFMTLKQIANTLLLAIRLFKIQSFM